MSIFYPLLVLWVGGSNRKKCQQRPRIHFEKWLFIIQNVENCFLFCHFASLHSCIHSGIVYDWHFKKKLFDLSQQINIIFFIRIKVTKGGGATVSLAHLFLNQNRIIHLKYIFLFRYLILKIDIKLRHLKATGGWSWRPAR